MAPLLLGIVATVGVGGPGGVGGELPPRPGWREAGGLLGAARDSAGPRSAPSPRDGRAPASRLAGWAELELAPIEARLDGLERAVQAIQAQLGAGRRIVRSYAGGVALLHATMTFVDADGRVLRYRDVDERGRPARGPLGWPRLTVEGAGPVVRMTLLATGFVVSRDGLIVTTRHAAEPWDGDPILTRMLEEGLRPRVSPFRAFFPDVAGPVSLAEAGRSATADVMLFRTAGHTGALPVLPMEGAPGQAVPGQPIVLLGYPGGLQLLLARIEPERLREVLPGEASDVSDETVDVAALLERLSRLGLIRPYLTAGHLADVRPHQLALDAETGVGGSGGPILSTDGRVIGLTYAVTRGFDSFKFGVPIRPAAELVRAVVPGLPPGAEP